MPVDGLDNLGHPDFSRMPLPVPFATPPGASASPPGAPGHETQGPTAESFHGSEAWTRSLVDRAGLGIFRCSAGGELLDTNLAMARMLGFPDAVSLKASGLFDTLWSSREERERCLAELSNGAREISHDVEARRLDGRQVRLRLSVTAEHDASGRLRFVEGIAENITERERREEIVRRGERMASLGRTLAGVAHEINNPLAAISGFAQILLKREHSGEDRHALETILHESRRAARIVKDLLTIARREEGTARIRLDVNAVAGYIVDTQRYAMETRGIRATMHLAVEPAWVLADAAQLEQVVLNLVVNARQALETGLARRREDDRWIPTLRVSTRVEDGQVVLEVADNGPGIPARDLPRIWEPFWTTREEGEGAGLGLSVVHSIVGSLGGAIDVASAPGAATAFTVTLPYAAPEASAGGDAARAAGGVPSPRAARPLDILVVDDEDVIRELLSRCFARRGHAVLVAVNGEHALRLAEHGSFDVVISDLHMPGMDGWALIRRLRLLPSTAQTRFILSTGDATASPTGPGDDHRANVQVVNKPYDVDTLVDLVEGR
ncbi:MAG: ATP-binding protein [Gemmatimonadota bacterium]